MASVRLSVRPIVMLSPPKPLGCLGVKNQIPSCCLSVMLSPPKPLDEIQPNLECQLLTWMGRATTKKFLAPTPGDLGVRSKVKYH